ncbi:hypothetical protein FHW36_1011025 [Chitinophaga polysaccharea]|uniref:Uncharacterized protein n=1 Tax=Chitinophaga polysaccharea TaxID=1293035 RepID=A0A561Q440_9BACT|nr:hypothetical protein [Chitinophaga polysaccharea]TWF45099.1 hypothetical protein FHW36_1011025 [Chitinophaga polysaccharea]
MNNNSTGKLSIICKRYTENCRSIHWNSHGPLTLYAIKSIVIHGKQTGIRFIKNSTATQTREA